MKLVLIPGGQFQMGSPNDEEGPEKPFGIHPELQHKVRITRPFYLGIYHVTQEEYQRIMGTNPSRYSPTGEFSKSVRGLDTTRFPVENVTWYDAVEFCKRLSEKEGRKYRLPTERSGNTPVARGPKPPSTSAKLAMAAKRIAMAGSLMALRRRDPPYHDQRQSGPTNRTHLACTICMVTSISGAPIGLPAAIMPARRSTIRRGFCPPT